jgi:hypothetical protein
MTYEHKLVHEGMLADSWLTPRSVNPFGPSCMGAYYAQRCGFEKSEERDEKIVYGRQVYSMAPDGTFVLVHVKTITETWAELWAKKLKVHDVLQSLIEPAESGNTTRFLERLKDIDWDRRSADEFIRAVDLALKAGAHFAARDLATQGAEIHFDSEELQKYARVLAPPKPLAKTAKSDVRPKANIQWLTANKHNYKGQWVAIKNGVFITSAKTYKALIAELGNIKGRGILVTPIY